MRNVLSVQMMSVYAVISRYVQYKYAALAFIHLHVCVDAGQSVLRQMVKACFNKLKPMQTLK